MAITIKHKFVSPKADGADTSIVRPSNWNDEHDLAGLATGVADFLATPSSANLATAVTDETGSGALVFGTAPTIGNPAISGGTIDNAAIGGTTAAAGAFTTLASSSTTTLNGTTIPASKTLAVTDDKLSVFAATTSSELAGVISDETGSGALVFATSPALTTPDLGTPSAVTLTNATGLPVATGISGMASGVADFLAVPSSANLATAVTDETGSGALVFATSPTLVTPALGAATATSVNKVTLTAPATGATLTIADGKTLAASNSLTLTGTDSSSVAFGAGGTVAYTANKLSAFAATSSSELAGVISDETGSGALVFGTSPTIGSPAISGGTINNASIGATTASTGAFTTLSASTSVTTPSVTNAGTLALSATGANIATISTNGSERLRVDSSGNVGIGTTSPSYPLHVVNPSNANQGIDIRFPDSVTALLNCTRQGTGGFQKLRIGGQDGIEFFTEGTERGRFTAGGVLLVGTTDVSRTAGVGVKINPASYTTTPTVACVGTASTNAAADTYHVYSTGASAYRFYVGYGGTVFATNTTISAVSDARLKENIQDIDAGLDAVMALKPRKFDWKAGKGKDIKGDRGWIAQEFKQVFPDMVDEWRDPAPKGEEPYKSVRADLIPVLVKAMQEQQALIESLTARIAALEGN